MSNIVIGIDLGATRIKAVAIDEHGHILYQHYQPTNDGVWKNAIAIAVSEIHEKTGTSDTIVGISAPGSTVGGALLINCIKAELAGILTAAGQRLKVLNSAIVVGEERAVSLFESAYDEHAHRLAKLFENVGKEIPK